MMWTSLVIGAHLLAFHARARFTEDLDHWVRRTEENARKLILALRDAKILVTEEQVLRLYQGRNLMRLGVVPDQVDLLAFLGPPGQEFEFEETFARSESGELMGVSVKYLNKGDFVLSKQRAGRPKVLSDLALMEEIEQD